MKLKHNWILLCLVWVSVNSVGCSNMKTTEEVPVSAMSTDQLIVILQDPHSHLFGDAANEASLRKDDFSKLAPVLAQALQFPRRDSYLAGIALITMGTNAKTAIPYLISALNNESPYVRAYALLSLGVIGPESKCTIPQISQLLMDKDPTVRGAAANAIELITGYDLVDPGSEFHPTSPNLIPQDTSDNAVTQKAIHWWFETGMNLDWDIESGNCMVKKSK